MTRDEIFNAMLGLVPQAERDAVNSPTTKPVYEACAQGLAVLSERSRRRRQAGYIAPHSLQTHPPAGFPVTAKLELTLNRSGSTDLALYVAPRRLVVLGPSGRSYVNVDSIEWARRDESSSRVVMFECATPHGDPIPGECGNLDFLVNDDLNTPKGLPAGWFLPDHLSLEDASRGRSKGGASIVLSGGNSAIKDSGIPSTFEAEDVNLHAEILFSSDPTNIGKLYRIQAHLWPGIEEPAGSNIRPSYAVLDDQNVRERWQGVYQDDGGAFTDYTAAANDLAAGDVPLTPAAPAVDDALYFGAPHAINRIGLRIDTAGAGVYTIAWEIWDGFVWYTPAGLQDGSVGFTNPGSSYVSIGNLIDQVQTTVNGLQAYWVRARVSAFTGLTTAPVGGYSFPLTWQQLAPEEGSVEWAVRDFKDLGVEITSARHITLGRDDDLGLIGYGRNIHPAAGETQEAFRARLFKIPDVISPNALTRVLNRILAPLHLHGRIVDVGDQVLGFYLDVDALDYYGIGEVFPENKWKLLLSTWEAYGFFYAEVPWVGDGDFGMFYDEGPVYLLPNVGTYLGPSYDDGCYDGFSPFASNVLYKTIYNELERRKGGGIAFAILPDESLNTP